MAKQSKRVTEDNDNRSDSGSVDWKVVGSGFAAVASILVATASAAPPAYIGAAVILVTVTLLVLVVGVVLAALGLELRRRPENDP